MIATNPSWDAKNTALGKQPIYAFAIGGEGRIYTTHDLARAGVTNPPNYRAWLKTPRGASQSIDVMSGQSSIGELDLEVLEQNGEVRQLVGSTTLEGRTATLSVGYPGIQYAEFVPLHTYQLVKITPSRTYTSWLFRARDRQTALKRTIWANPMNGEPLAEHNPWILQGTPSEIVQAVYLWALGQDPGTLDLEGLRALDSAAEGLFKPARPFLFRLTESFEAKQFLENEIYKVCGCYPVIDNLGRLSLRAFRPPAAGVAPVYSFDTGNIIVLPEIDRMPVINEAIFKLDAGPEGAGTELVFIDATSVSTFGRAGQHNVESKGLRMVLGAQTFCQEIAHRLFRRFAGTSAGLRGGAPVARVEAFLMTLPVWVGDYVTVTHPLMPNLLTGELGVEGRLYEVIDREPDFARGRMRYRLLDTGLTGLAAAHKWAPSDRDFIIGISEIY